MSDLHDPEEVIDARRGPARAAELSGEADTIALMAQAHNAGGRTFMHSTSRRARVATLIAAGIIGFGGVAAAGAADQPIDMEEVIAAIEESDGGTSGQESTAEGTTEEVTTEEATEETTEDATTEEGTEDESTEDGAEKTAEDATTEEGTEDESTEDDAEVAATEEVEEESPTPEKIWVNEDGCVTDAEGNELNHGKTVSAVARDLIPDTKWASVSAAAQSDCGKKHQDEDGMSVEEDPAPVPAEDETVDEGDGEPAEDANDPAPEDSSADASATLTTSDSGKGKGAGNGKAKSNNGNGNGKKGGK